MGDPPFDWTQCLDLVRDHDEAAARRLVEELFPMVMKIIQSRAPRREAPEDLCQEIFLKMFSRLDQYRGAVPFHHWVSRIAVNHCLNSLRAERKRPEWRWADLSEEQQEVLDAVVSGPDEIDPSRGLAARETVEMLLSALDPKDALVLRLMELEDKSVEEIRALTGWTSTKIRVRAFRARRRLRRQFSKLLASQPSL